MGQSEQARQRHGAFAPPEHFASGKISPQGGFTPPEEVDPPERFPRRRLRGESDCPPAAQEKAIAAAKAMQEE